MKIKQLAAALMAYSGSGKMPSANAADVNGYTGSDYTYFADRGTPGWSCQQNGNPNCDGPCLSGVNGYHFGTGGYFTDDAMTVDMCAQYCQNKTSVKGQIGFDVSIFSGGKCSCPSCPSANHRNPCRCDCKYTSGSGPESFTSSEGVQWDYGATWPIVRTNLNNFMAFGSMCYKHNNYGRDPPTVSPTNAPSTSPSTKSPSTSPSKSPSKTPTGSPTNVPSTSPSKSPSKTPTGSPTNVPSTSPSKSPTVTGSPSQGPSKSPSVTGSPSQGPSTTPPLENSLYYPDWTKSNGGCKTGGGQPTYMTNDSSTWMFATLNGCCVRYFGWMLNKCKGTSGAAPSGLWFPDWEGSDDTCKNDGSEPEYMAMNPGSWMHSSKEDCCGVNFSWMLNECIGSSANTTDKWYMKWDQFKCKKDCDVSTGPSCGGRANSWDGLFDTRSACCAEKAAWNPKDCLID